MVNWFIKEFSFEVRVRGRGKGAVPSNAVEELESIIKKFCDENDEIDLTNFKLEHTPYVEIRDE